jgi:hypothetical protein
LVSGEHEQPMNDDSQGSPFQGLVVSGRAGGAGCIVPLMIILAIVVGRQLDRWLGTEPWILLGLILVSIPLSLGLMVLSALGSTRGSGIGLFRQHRAEADFPLDTYEEDNR